jgi:hypothetical protein
MTPTPLQYFTKDHAVSMTLRDYFAAKAMQAFCSTLRDVSKHEAPLWNVLANDAYEMADAMMKARGA